MSNGVDKAAEGTVALFGTSADPPTRGHQALLEGHVQLYPQVATRASDNPQKHHGAPWSNGQICWASWWQPSAIRG